MKTILFTFSLSLFSLLAYAIDIPSLTSPVIDQAGLLTKKQKIQLESLFHKIKREEGPQLQILTVKNLQGESIENFSIEVVDKWQLGDKQRDDGVLLLVSTGDRKLRIEVGDGLEGVLTDYKSGKIIRGMTKYFKNNQLDQGILYGASEIIKTIGIDSSEIKVKKRRRRPLPFSTIFSFIIIAIYLRLNRTFGTSLRGRRGYYGGGGFLSGGGSSSFGSWGGGGGGFSGGGSSGSW